MHITLWILQTLLALHTLVGAVWKFSHDSQSVPSLQAIPHDIWIALAIVEIAVAVLLVLPALKSKYGQLVPMASALIAAEMLFFCGIGLGSPNRDGGQIGYWAVVFAICAFIAWGRAVRRPHL